MNPPPCTSRLTEANRREYARLSRLLLGLIESAQDRPGRGDHAELRVTWDGRGVVRGELRGSLEPFIPNAESA